MKAASVWQYVKVSQLIRSLYTLCILQGRQATKERQPVVAVSGWLSSMMGASEGQRLGGRVIRRVPQEQ